MAVCGIGTLARMRIPLWYRLFRPCTQARLLASGILPSPCQFTTDTSLIKSLLAHSRSPQSNGAGSTGLGSLNCAGSEGGIPSGDLIAAPRRGAQHRFKLRILIWKHGHRRWGAVERIVGSTTDFNLTGQDGHHPDHADRCSAAMRFVQWPGASAGPIIVNQFRPLSTALRGAGGSAAALI